MQPDVCFFSPVFCVEIAEAAPEVGEADDCIEFAAVTDDVFAAVLVVSFVVACCATKAAWGEELRLALEDESAPTKVSGT